MIEVSSPFQFNSFLNIDHFLVTLFTPICIFGRKPGNGTKSIIKTFPLPHLHQPRGPRLFIYEDGGERSSLLHLHFPINFPDCVLRGGAGENPQGLNRGYSVSCK